LKMAWQSVWRCCFYLRGKLLNNTTGLANTFSILSVKSKADGY
jgi:hypothetical protein